ncbi:Rad1/Rec1/Rad17 [Crassisporium funariophilum]|nr:Rad1/Rec1/Rad17 [Crassisporium funariophilum]
MSQEENLPPVLVASVHDVRYFAALLRGVNFVNRAMVTVTDQGLTITVEEAHTLLGTAFIFAEIFDEYAYHAEASETRPKLSRRLPAEADASETESESEQEEPSNAAFEIPLNTLIECLNIFGTAGPLGAATTPGASGGAGGGGKAAKRWHRTGDDDSDDERGRGRGLDNYFAAGGPEKKTGMRLSYAGAGYPLTLIIAEDASGPTTTCEIATFTTDDQLELDFDNSRTVLKIILKSSWLRDALSELDPSCEKLTFIGYPPPNPQEEPTRSNHTAGPTTARQKQKASKPMLRIQAGGTFGSTEMDYPNDRDVLETFECKKGVSFSYRFGHISRTLRALQSSTKTSLRIDDRGLLSLQFIMPSPKPKGASGGADAFIEFRCLALDDRNKDDF